LGFELDDFQIAACQGLEDGRSVLVAAPTGAGKTIVGEFAIDLALASGRKAFYTTPIKALSNQKFHDLVAAHGEASVGLLTGDTSINGEAPVVVMTTEVLRNMLYAGSATLTGLDVVVMDEVHYLADRFRGPVWEEVIIHLPDHVRLVSLSATVSNAEEFGDWLRMVRGDMDVVVSERRPVPLWQHVALAATDRGSDARGGARILDLYAESVDPTAPGTNPPINPEVTAAFRASSRRTDGGQFGTGRGKGMKRGRDGGRSSYGGNGSHGGGHSGGQPAGDRGYRGRGGHRVAALDTTRRGGHRGSGRGGNGHGGVTASVDRRPTPKRFAVLTALRDAGLLPVIYFIFSRAGCEGAVDQVMRSGLTFTSPKEQSEIRRIVEQRCASIPPEDLDILGYWAWLDALSRGVAAHHAGLLPVFKETVEELFASGKAKVVFATETLALGINMPAKSVVLEKLVKFNGASHEALTPGEYTQLTGRAGRRGIDVEGHAVVVDHQGLDPVALAGLASKRTYPLKSSFRPTYNMSVNLIASLGEGGYARARQVLELSFAQFQADRGAVGLARDVRRYDEALTGYAKAIDREKDNPKARTRWQKRYDDASRDRQKLLQRIDDRTGTVARTFDKICSVLESLGYLDGHGGVRTITDDGQWLRRIYAENDLLLAECLRRGTWNRLAAPDLAAAVSTVVYSGRRESAGEPFIPGGPRGELAKALDGTARVWQAVTDLEESHGLETTGDLDLGIVAPVQRWCAGRSLSSVLRGTDLAAGDFVRWCKQVVDVLDQLAGGAPSPSMRATARRAKEQIVRGVVAYSRL
jgi:ATP-dependent RNA helicase HelY